MYEERGIHQHDNFAQNTAQKNSTINNLVKNFPHQQHNVIKYNPIWFM